MKYHALRTAALAIVAAFVQFASFGGTATANGYTWNYMDEGCLRITAVLPTPSGKVVVPAQLNDIEVGAIDAIFAKCPELEEVVLPKGLQDIAGTAFDGSPNLKRISMVMSAEAVYFTLDGVLYEGSRMGDATLVRVPEGYEAETFKGLVGPRVTGIYENAFANCSKIAKIAVNDF